MAKTKIKLPMTGGCQCGAIRYEISVMPKTLYACHCTECQRQSSAGFGMSMPVDKEGFKLLNGKPKIWERSSASGRKVGCAFCPTCGTRIFHAPERNQSIVNIKPGTLDNTKWITPVAHLWLDSAQPWVLIPEGVAQYPKQPASFEPIFDAWQNHYESEEA